MSFYLQGFVFPVVDTLSVLAIICQLSSVCVAVLLLRNKDSKLLKKVSGNGLLLMLIISFAASSGSMFFSEIAGWAPCKLCWFQRIFMYPQVLLVGYAIWKSDKTIFPYILILSLVGMGVSVFHYAEQVIAMFSPNDVQAPCDMSGVSCSATYIQSFGYITIPMLALTAFTANALISWSCIRSKKNINTPKAAAVVIGVLFMLFLVLTITHKQANPEPKQAEVVPVEKIEIKKEKKLIFTPKANLKEVKAVEGIHWTHTPAVPQPVTRKDQRKVIVEWEATEMIGDLDAELDLQYEFWGFEGSTPGPTLRVKQGDLVEFRLTNNIKSKHPHNIDFHFSTGPGGGAKALNVAPGETAVVHLRATHPGFFMYHCATPDIPTHIANGMYGGVIVDPIDPLPEVDQEFVIVQSEFYTDGTETGLAKLDLDAVDAEHPTHVVFNGAVGSLTGDNSPHVNVGDNVRLWVLNAGPQLISSFHVIGEIFDSVYREADFYSVPGRGIQSTLIPAGGASVVDFVVDVPGTYILVDHAIARAIHKGAVGTIIAEGKDNLEIFESFVTGEVPDGHMHKENGEVEMTYSEEEKEEEDEDPPMEKDENEVIVEIMKGSMIRDDDPLNDYSPNVLTVPAGTTVTWVNKDRSVHTVTDRNRLFNSGNMRKGKRWSYTFTKPGEYEYYCIPHPWMVGKVIVK